MPVNPIPTTADRLERGRAARRYAPRSALGTWAPGDDRDDPVAVLVAQNDIRNPDLVALRHGRMAISPWNFYRGAAAVMAMDLAALPHSGLAVQLCGDAHILNFGLWATPERNLSFDLRDFDETLPGPFEWDVARLAASIVVLARHNGLGDAVGVAAVEKAVGAYHARMDEYAASGQMEIWYDLVDVDWLLDHFQGADRTTAAALIAKQGERRTNQGAFDQLTTVVDGQRRIAERPPKLQHFDSPDRLRIVEEVFERYAATLRADRRHCVRQFEFVDVARQVVGVGSVGMRVHLLLLEDRTGEPLFLQVKQAGPSVYERHLGDSTYDNHGARVINGQRLLQSATDMFVGWTQLRGHGLLRPTVPRHEDHPGHRPPRTGARRLRHRVRRGAGQGPRPHRRPRGHLRLPRQGPHLRGRHGRLRRALRRPHRGRPRRARRGDRRRGGPGRVGVTSVASGTRF